MRRLEVKPSFKYVKPSRLIKQFWSKIIDESYEGGMKLIKWISEREIHLDNGLESIQKLNDQIESKINLLEMREHDNSNPLAMTNTMEETIPSIEELLNEYPISTIEMEFDLKLESIIDECDNLNAEMKCNDSLDTDLESIELNQLELNELISVTNFDNSNICEQKSRKEIQPTLSAKAPPFIMDPGQIIEPNIPMPTDWNPPIIDEPEYETFSYDEDDDEWQYYEPFPTIQHAHQTNILCRYDPTES